MNNTINTIEGLAIIAGMLLLIYFLSYKEQIRSRVRARSYRAKRIPTDREMPLDPATHKARLKIPGYYEEKPNSKAKKYDEIDLTRMFI